MSKIDPPAGWPDVDGIDTFERLLGGPLPTSPMNRSIGNLVSRTKQLRADLATAQAGVAQVYTDLGAPTGASRVGFRAAGSSVTRTVQDKLRDVVSVKDFGALGDGATDDTAAFLSAIASVKVTGAALHLPAGTYRISSTLAAGRIFSNQQLRIFGDGSDLTKLQATASLTGPVLEVGAESVAGYSGSVWLQDFAISGAGIGVTARGLRLWGVVHADFTRLFATGCDVGFENRGGIDVDFEGCFAYRNAVGFNVDRWIIGSDTSWPNITNLLRCEVKDNTQWGVRFDNGRMLNIMDSDIETNGTVSDLGTGGIYVGPGVNNETPGVDGQGLVIERTWLEANAGLSTIVYESGVNTIKSCTIVANAGAVNDVLVKGGNYHILHSHIAPFKTSNVLEELTAAVKVGNSIVDTYGGIYSFDITKTQRQYAPFVARAANLPNMTLQMGRVTSGAGQVVVTFPTPFAPGSTVEVFTQIRNLSSATLDEVEVHSTSPTQFTMERKSVAIPPGTSISTAGTYAVSWLAIGQMS